jgi:hypothetical protein
VAPDGGGTRWRWHGTSSYDGRAVVVRSRVDEEAAGQAGRGGHVQRLVDKEAARTAGLARRQRARPGEEAMSND